MAVSRKRMIKKVMNWAGVAFFVFAVYALYSQLSKHSWVDIKGALLAIPGFNLLLALAAAAAGYVVLSMYEWLALRYIGRKLATWKWMLAGFMGFAITNNAGTAIVTGAAMRYRLYTMWKIQLSNIIKMIIFSGFTYLTGCFFLLAVGYFLIPEGARGASVISLVVWPSVAALLAYLFVTLFYHGKKVNIGEHSMKIPSTGTMLAQGILGFTDTVVASLVLYSVLSALVPVDFSTYVGVFAISQVIGVYTPVPGALGVFEGLFMFLLPEAQGNEAAVFAALIAYRIIYFLIPLAFTGAIMAFMTIQSRRRYRRVTKKAG